MQQNPSNPSPPVDGDGDSQIKFKRTLKACIPCRNAKVFTYTMNIYVYIK